MAKYSDIKGFTVQTVSTDPAASAAATGAWASGGNMNTTHAYAGGAGIQTAALVFAGVTPAQTANTESYDGTSWTEVNNMNQAAGYLESAGVVYTAALAIGGHRPGSPTAFTELWDGTNWTEVADLNSARSFAGSSGSATSALIYGGIDPSYPPHTGKTESWDGSSWTEVSDLNTVREINAGIGVNSSNAITAGGTPGPTTVESWDGSSWTEVSEINTGRYAAAGFGAYNDGIICGGHTGSAPTTATESWNGSSWTEVADLAQTRTALKSGYGCPSGVGIAFGGIAPPGSTYKNNTEEWTTSFTPTTLKKITEGQLFFNSTANAFKETITDIPSGAWASSGNLNQARNILDAQNGTQSSSKASGGSPPGTAGLANVEDYDGSSWSETTEMNTPRYSAAAAGASNTSALVFSGYNNSSPLASPGGYLSATESWNGSAWTEVNDLNIKMSNRSGNGIQTSALCYGGYESPYALTESWDGTNWTEVSDLNTGRMDLGGIGDSNTSALAFGGLVAPNTKSDKTESWDGTSWTEVNDLNTNRAYVGGSGSRDLAIAFGGESPPVRANTEAWNGTSWTEINDLSTARKSMGSSGSAAAGLAAGGNDGSTVLTATEEFTAFLANKTITTS